MNAGSVVTVEEFEAAEEGAWRPIDDRVMGGVSASRLTLTSAGTGVFEGTLSLANNGGFASVRRSIGLLDLGAHPGIVLRVRGDGRRYRLRLRTDGRFDGVAWAASFETTPDRWEVVELPFVRFEPSYRGRRPPGAGPVDPTRICQLGLMIADRQAGPFRLEIDWIRAAPSPEGG